MRVAEVRDVVHQVGVQRKRTMNVLRVIRAKQFIVILIVPITSMVPKAIRAVLHGVQVAVDHLVMVEEDPRLLPVVPCVITAR